MATNCGDKTVEIPIDVNEKLENVKENEYGCSNGKNIGKAILPLFAFNLLKNYEKRDDISEFELSVSSGVLCKFTRFVGVSKEPNVNKSFKYDSFDSDDDIFMYRSAKRKPMKNLKAKKKDDSIDSSDSSDSTPLCKKKAVKKPIKMAMNSDSSDSIEEKIVKPKAKRMKAKHKIYPKAKQLDSDSFNKKLKPAVDSDSDSNDENPLLKKEFT